MADTGSGPEIPRGQGYGPPPRSPPHPMDGQRRGYPQDGPQGPAAYPPGPPPYGAQPAYLPPPSKPMSGKAIASLVCGVVSVFMWPLAVIGGPAALVTGIMALKETGPHQGKSGRGLAIGGMIAGCVMFVACLGFAALFFFVFQFADKEQKRLESQVASETEARVDSDLRLIRDRLQLYYMENGKSLKAGGPIVADGWEGGLFDENSPKVKGRLEMRHLVRPTDLIYELQDYELDVEGDNKVKVKNRDKGRELVVDDIGTEKFAIRAIEK